MARRVTHLVVEIDPADRAAFQRECEAIVLKFGYPPQPHNQRAFDEEVQRAITTLTQCVTVRAAAASRDAP